LLFLGEKREKNGKKKHTGYKSNNNQRHAPLHQEEDVMTHPTTLQKDIFGCQEALHTPSIR
jgi:hypothetical protein